jgi:hypothetical protein
MKRIVKLTEAQIKILRRIETLTSNGNPAHKTRINGARMDVLDRLFDSGYIHSAQPFSRVYHSVTLTEKGLQAVS